jgi:hypothetical protein
MPARRLPAARQGSSYIRDFYHTEMFRYRLTCNRKTALSLFGTWIE